MKSRAELVKSILVDVKSRILAETGRFDIVFYKIDFLAEGFGFKFEIKPRGTPTADTLQEFSEIKHYVSEMFGYLFNEEISVSSFTGDCVAEYEIVSKY